MKNLNLIIGNNLRELRKTHKLTQSELAEKINYSNKAVSRWESGEVVPDVETLNNICELFNVPLAVMFEENIAPKQLLQNNHKQGRNKIIITLLAIMAVWCIAIVGFTYSNIVLKANLWQMFIWAIPVSAIVALVFSAIWGKRWTLFACLTVLLWSLLLAVFITFREYRMWLIFLTGIPLQLCIILWSNLGKKPKIKNNEK